MEGEEGEQEEHDAVDVDVDEGDDDDTSVEEIILDEEDSVNKPEVLKAVKMLQESSKQQLLAYNHLIGAIPSMTDTEMRKVAKTVPKPDISVPHSVLEVYDEYSEANFHHMLAVGHHLFEQFAASGTKPPQKATIFTENMHSPEHFKEESVCDTWGWELPWWICQKKVNHTPKEDPSKGAQNRKCQYIHVQIWHKFSKFPEHAEAMCKIHYVK